MEKSGAAIISWNFSEGDDTGVLLIGKQINRQIDIINAFQGKEAIELCKKLMNEKEEMNPYKKTFF